RTDVLAIHENVVSDSEACLCPDSQRATWWFSQPPLTSNNQWCTCHTCDWYGEGVTVRIVGVKNVYLLLTKPVVESPTGLHRLKACETAKRQMQHGYSCSHKLVQHPTARCKANAVNLMPSHLQAT